MTGKWGRVRLIRVLIADNNVELCQALEDFLGTQVDIEVVGIAYNGEEALRMIAEVRPDVCILDITMPRLDGMAVLERVAGLGLPHAPRFIVLTALSRDDLVQRFTDLGADYFIVKPFDLSLLAERIRQFASRDSGGSVREGAAVYRSAGGNEDEVGVTRLLHEIGIPAHFKGYSYLRDAVLMALRDEQLLGGALTKKLYPRLAEKYESTPGGVEAAIRNAVLAAWDSGNRDFLERLTGGALRRGRFPTNSLLIAKLVDELRLGTRTG